jgi:hypothetical protein
VATQPQPPRVSDNPQVQQDYMAQLALSAAVVAGLAHVWPSFDPKRPRLTFPDVRRPAAALIVELSSAAASLAADHFETLRDEAHVAQPFRVPIIDLPSQDDIEHELDRVTADILDGSSSDFEALRQAIEAQIESSAQKMIADAASNEQMAAVEADPQAIGWARVTRPGACAFCLMLATRGPVYGSKTSASFRPHVAVNGKGGTCHCTVEPLWRGTYEPAAHVREAQAIWKSSTKGRSGKDALRAFRRAIEGGNLRERPVPIPAAPAVPQRDQFNALIAALADVGAVPVSR